MTTDEEKLIINNIQLAYDIAWKFSRKLNGLIEFDELKSICLYGLTKAAKTYNINLGYNFSTYSYKIIYNEVLLELKYINRQNNTISLSTKFTEELEIQDVIPDSYNLTESLENDILNKDLKIAINGLNPIYKQIMLYKLQGLTFKDISNIINIPSSKVINIYNKALNVLRDKLKNWN